MKSWKVTVALDHLTMSQSMSKSVNLLSLVFSIVFLIECNVKIKSLHIFLSRGSAWKY